MFIFYVVNFKSLIVVDLLDYMDFEILLVMLDMGWCLEINYMCVVKILRIIIYNFCFLCIVRKR